MGVKLDSRGQYLRISPREVEQCLEWAHYFNETSLDAGPDLPDAEFKCEAFEKKLERYAEFHRKAPKPKATARKRKIM